MKNNTFATIASIIAGMAIMVYLVATNISLNHENELLKESYHHNMSAMYDSLKKVRLDNDKLLYEKRSFQITEAELNDKLGISERQQKELKKKLKSAISYIAKVEGQLKIDSVKVDTIIVKEEMGIHQLNFKHQDRWLSFNGKFDIDSTFTPRDMVMNDIIIPVPITLGLTEKKNIFVTSENPYVSVTDINGAHIKREIQKQKHWHHGIGIGFGVQYGLKHEKFDFGPQLGYHLLYTF